MFLPLHKEEEEWKKVASACYNAGYAEGLLIGLKESIPGYLTDLGDVTDSLRSRTEQEKDLTVIHIQLKMAVRTVSLDSLTQEVLSDRFHKLWLPSVSRRHLSLIRRIFT